MNKQVEYNKILLESGLFFAGPSKGSFILPPNGLILWQNIQNLLNQRFAKHEIKNVSLPTLIPYSFFQKEKQHIQGFSPEFFQIQQIGEKKLTEPLILRPTSEVLFYDWFRQILRSYQQLPFLYNQWCQVFRAEKNTKPFLRNTEFFWQEGHTLHETEQEAQEFAQKIWQDYQEYVEKNLCLAIIAGRKSEKEKFAGATESYTVECLLPDGQCLQLATSHYFGDSFCRAMNVKFQNKWNRFEHPFSTSWGTSTRAVGALALAHQDERGLILPFSVAPIQIAFIVVNPKNEPGINEYQKELCQKLSNEYGYRCKLYDEKKQFKQNLDQADREGCLFKIVIGEMEWVTGDIVLIFRRSLEGKKWVNTNDNLIRRTIENWKNAFDQTIYQKTVQFLDEHIYPTEEYELLKHNADIKKSGIKGLFLIPFCNNLDCEETIVRKLPSYSIRCISLTEKPKGEEKCIFCAVPAMNYAYLGRSY